MKQPEKIIDTLILEVTNCEEKSTRPNGWSKPAVDMTFITLKHRSDIRPAQIVIPGNLPIGTRFKMVVEQIDEVTCATIQRGALPIIEDRNLLAGGNDEVQ